MVTRVNGHIWVVALNYGGYMDVNAGGDGGGGIGGSWVSGGSGGVGEVVVVVVVIHPFPGFSFAFRLRLNDDNLV